MAWLSGWDHRKEITIQSAEVVEDLTDFPVTIVLASDADIAAGAQADGDDITFTSSDETTQLDHEIEKYDNSTGELIAHVKVPSILAASGATIYVYYGNAGAANQEDAAGTWSNGYISVHHLHEDPSGGVATDSTGNANGSFVEPSGAGTITQAAGPYGQGYQFPGDTLDRVEFDDLDTLQGDDITIEILLYGDDLSANDRRCFTQQDGGATQNHYHKIGTQSGDTPRYRQKVSGDTASWVASGTTIPEDNWYLLSGSFDSTAGDISLFAGNVATGTWLGEILDSSDSGVATPGTVAHRIGTGTSTSHGFPGRLKEARLSTVARSAGWRETQFNNVADPSSFISLGVEEDDPGSGGSVSGSAAGAATATGSVAGTVSLSGSAAGSATVSGTLETGALAGSSAGSSTATGNLTSTASLSGTSAGTSTATATAVQGFTPASLNDISGIRINLWSHLQVTDDGSGEASAWADQFSEGNDLSASEGDRPDIVTDAVAGYQALQCSAAGDYIDRATLVSGARSATSWVALYCKMANATLGADEFLCSAVGTARFAIFYDGGTGELKIFNGTTLTSTHTIDTSWHLIFVQFRGATTRIYVDGVQVAEGNDGGGSADGFRLGARFDGNNASDALFAHASAGDGDIVGTADFDLIRDNIPAFYAEGALSGASAGTSTASGNLTGAASLSASASGSATGSGSLIGYAPVTGTSTGASTASGSLAAIGRLIASPTGAATTAASITATGSVSGQSSGGSTASASIEATASLSGTSAGFGASSGSISGQVDGALSGTSTGSTTTSASLTATASLSGTSSGISVASSSLSADASLIGSAVGESTASASLIARGEGSVIGASSGSSTVSASLSGRASLSGPIVSSSLVSGALSGLARVAAVAAGTALVAGSLASIGNLSGNTAATSTGSATIRISPSISGSSTGTSSVTGSVIATGYLSGTSGGFSSVSGTHSSEVSEPEVEQEDPGFIPPPGYMEIPLWFYPYVRRLQWSIPVKVSAWLTPKERDIALHEIAAATKSWAVWEVVEDRRDFGAPHTLLVRAKARNSNEVKEISIDFKPTHRTTGSKFLARLKIATNQLRM